MFIGHVALALAAKRVTPRVSLAWLLVAAVFADILWPLFIRRGIEVAIIREGETAFTPIQFQQYPYSHSLLMLALWGLLVGGAYFATILARRARHAKYLETIGRPSQVGWRRSDIMAGPVLAGLVMSHWILDYITHRPDLPLYPGGARYGLGLWNSIPGTVAVELGMLACGVVVYVFAMPSRNRKGQLGLVAFLLAVLGGYAMNAMTVPRSVHDLIQPALVGIGVLTAAAWWFDRHRGKSRRGSRRAESEAARARRERTRHDD